MSRGAPLVIGVVGGSGSGKTTVVRAIQESAGSRAALLDQDAYYHDLGHLTLEERKLVNFDHPDSIDTTLFVDHVTRLARRESVEKPIYDFPAHTRGHGTLHVAPADIVVVDGILLFADERLRQLFDLRIFVDVADDVRFIRRLQRDLTERGRSVDNIIDQYLRTVRPMHLEFVEPSKRHAHIIIPEGSNSGITVEFLCGMIREKIKELQNGGTPVA